MYFSLKCITSCKKKTLTLPKYSKIAGSRPLYQTINFQFNLCSFFQEVISLAAHHRSVSPLSPSQTPRFSISPRSGRTGYPHVSAGVRVGTSVSGVTEESIISEIYTHYCGLAHKALLQCIQRSLEILYHSVCPAEMIKKDENR